MEPTAPPPSSPRPPGHPRRPSRPDLKLAALMMLAGLLLGLAVQWGYRRLGPGADANGPDEGIAAPTAVPDGGPEADAGSDGERPDQVEFNAQLPCHPAEPRGDFLARAKDWNGFLDGLTDPAQAVAALNARLAGPGMPLRLGTPDPTLLVEGGKDAYERRYPNRLDEEESGGNPGTWLFLPGRIDVTVRMGSDAAPSGDLVVELEGTAAASREVRRWRVPLESAPEAVAGDELLEQGALASLCRQDVRTLPAWLAFRPDGTFRAVPTPRGAPAEPQAAQDACPPVADFGPSDFVTCAWFRDLKSGKRRLLVWQSPSS